MSWRTLTRHGLLQTRVLEDRVGGGLHLTLVVSLAGLAVSSAVAPADAHLLMPRTGWRLAPPGWDAVPEVAGLLLLVTVVGLLARRLQWRPAHLPSSWQATTILVALALITLSGFALEGLAMSQQTSNHQPGAFVGAWIAALLGPDPGLADGSAGGVRLSSWRWLFWCHAGLGLALIAALPFSRLRHAVAAPLQQLRRRSDRPEPLTPPFRLDRLVEEGSFDLRFGIAEGRDLATRRVELNACASCGRCDERCPVHAVGGELSPRALVAGLAATVRSGHDDRPLPTGLSEGAIWSCLCCGACSEACPSLIQPHLLVAELRRGLLRTGRSSAGPDRVLANLTRSGNPYGQPRWAREELPEELDLPTLDEERCPDWLYWVGCAGTYDPRVRQVVAATVALLRGAGLTVAILAEEECCTGDPARRSGEEARFQELATGNLHTLRELDVRRIVTHCPHCLHSLRTEYAALGPVPEVVHHTELLARLVRDGRLRVEPTVAGRIVLHDPCYLARFQDTTVAPRHLLGLLPAISVELPDHGRRTRCCGGGGPATRYDAERVDGLPEARLAQAREAGAELVATACPFCLKMLEQAQELDRPLPVHDLAELLGPCPGDPRP